MFHWFSLGVGGKMGGEPGTGTWPAAKPIGSTEREEDIEEAT